MIRKTLSISLAVIGTLALLGFSACSSDDPGTDGGDDAGRDTNNPPPDQDQPDQDKPDSDGGNPPPDADGGNPPPDGGAFPPAPAIGATQIDRLGRPAINTALTNPFYDHVNGGGAHATIQDEYNASADPAAWRDFAADFITPLAAFDALDGVCGNSVGTPASDPGSAMLRYGTIAGALADDRLFVNTGSSTCEAFLGVEANTLAAVGLNGGAANTDCGGRTPLYDTISIYYSLLSGAFDSLQVGAIPTYTGSAPDPTASAGTFPWLGDPL
jgi:hypothetical protein